MNLLSLLQASQVVTEVATGSSETQTYWDLALKGGLTMIPLAIMLVIAVYIIIERIVVLGKASKEDISFMNRIKDYIFEGKIDSALNLCKQTNNPSARMVEKGLAA
jgi:biopolymer transport protein ExbB